LAAVWIHALTAENEITALTLIISPSCFADFFFLILTATHSFVSPVASESNSY